MGRKRIKCYTEVELVQTDMRRVSSLCSVLKRVIQYLIDCFEDGG